MAAYGLLCLSWVLFGLIHSLTATNWLKQLSSAHGWINQRYYRLVYNGLSLITGWPVLAALQRAPTEPIGSWHGSIWIGGFVIGLGGVIIVLALAHYNLAEFIGWPPQLPTNQAGDFRQNGLLRYVRHPLYLGTLVVLAGLLIAHPDWKQLLFDLMAFLYLRVGIFFEERKLVRTFGDLYVQYQQRVPMLMPGF